MFTVTKCVYQKKDQTFIDGWLIISDDNKYPYYANKFLHQIGTGSQNTARQYAYKLSTFLNYIYSILSIDYKEATISDLKKFIRYMQYGNTMPLGIVEGIRSGFTIKSYITVIKRFYQFLHDQDMDLNVTFADKIRINPHSYLYGQNWVDISAKLQLDDTFDRSKPPIEYEKWYTEEQIRDILNGFNTLRDKTIFSFSLDGMRIDEILSCRMSNYDDIEGCIILFRSKGRKTGQTNRTVVLSDRSRKLLEDYLFTERSSVENNLIDQGVLPPDEIFLNLKMRTGTYGKPMGYHNILEIIKRAGASAGIDPSRIRTHSGRSTKAGELFRYQAAHPEELSDNQIKEIMGWRELSSAEPYKNRQDKETIKLTAKRLRKIQEERHNKNADN